MAQKVAVSREFEAWLHHAATGKLCQPNRKWVPFSNYDDVYKNDNSHLYTF